MALVTVQRSPSPSASAEEDEADALDTSDSLVKSPRQRSFSESYFAVKGAALILPQSDDTVYTRKSNKSHTGDEIQLHLQAMISLLRPQDTIKVAVKLEGSHTRYLALVSCTGRQDTEESVILGMDLLEKASIGLVLPVYAHMHIKLDGDGGFTIQSDNNIHIFKPVSVQAMWSALQSLNKVVKVAKDKLYIPRGLTHTWVGFYEAKLTTEAVLVSEWNATEDIDRSYRSNKQMLGEVTGQEDIYKRIRHELKNVMMTVDLEEVTCIFLRKSIEEKLGMDLKAYKSFIDTEMLEILGQMDAPSKILDYLYLGSEWNASNLEELEAIGVHHILNISKEIDNFYPGTLHYMNVREWDVEASDLMRHWEDTHKFINKARKRSSNVLVHCKMGISRSASTVIAYLMKEKKWPLQQAFDYTKSKRSIINPNQGFWRQLETYEGILTANWNRAKFNSHAPVKPLPAPDESEEMMMDVPFPSPEELLAVNLGKDSTESAETYSHMEQDIELASRSADSTEESLPDQLSPVTIETRQKKHKDKSEREKTESGDHLETESEDSEYTSDSELSDDEAEEDDTGVPANVDKKDSEKIFIPVDLPDEEIAVERKRPVRVQGRKCKSESDKNLLSVDEITVLGSREGSVSKFKPDASWIKPPSESDDYNSSALINETDNIAGDRVDDSGGLWMGKAPQDEEKLECKPSEDDDCVSEGFRKEGGDSQCSKNADTNVVEPYIKENIPWHPGTVKRQKEDIEVKYGGPSIAKKESLDSNEPQSTPTQQLQNSQGTEKDTAVESVVPKTELVNKSESCDSTSQSDESKTNYNQSAVTEPVTEETVNIQITRSSESPKTVTEVRKSVYEEEEIDLPAGIVKKTTQEIEERNRSFLDIPSKGLKRSSSLKSTRVTPKAKDRDSERRKTCIALLSPTHPDYTGRDSESSFNVSDSEVMSPGTEDDQGHKKPVFELASDDSDEETGTKAGSIKVYKFMGEELTLQEGMVRKQTLDIESKKHETSVKPIVTVETSTTAQEQSVKTKDTLADVKQSQSPIAQNSERKSSELKSVEKLQTCDKDKNNSAVNADKSACSCSNLQTDDAKSRDGAAQKTSDTSSDKTGNVPSTSLTPGKKKMLAHSRFDSETLELIREIGSALLNSPAKSELEENEDEDLREGESLVSHYVRKIERMSGVKKRKCQKEIVIIDKLDNSQNDQKLADKDSAEHSEMSRRLSTSSQTSGARKHIFTPQGSKETDEDLHRQTESAITPKWSPVSKKEIASPGMPSSSILSKEQSASPSKSLSSTVDKSELTLSLKTAFKSDTQPEKNQASSKEVEGEKCSVKELLGKFEQTEQVSGKSSALYGSPTVQSPVSNTAVSQVLKAEPVHVSSQKSLSVSGPGLSSVDILGQGHLVSRSVSVAESSDNEPTIELSEKSLKLFEAKLREMGTSLFEKTPRNNQSETSDLEPQKGQGDSEKPKSASYGPAAGRKVTGNGAQASSAAVAEGQQQFPWDGRKVRKSYGKSHPLAKLEGRTYGDSARNSPFYNTM